MTDHGACCLNCYSSRANIILNDHMAELRHFRTSTRSSLSFSSKSDLILHQIVSNYLQGQSSNDAEAVATFHNDHYCSSCSRQFTIIRRLQNCRLCGISLCSRCVQSLDLSPFSINKFLSICDSCNTIYRSKIILNQHQELLSLHQSLTSTMIQLRNSTQQANSEDIQALFDEFVTMMSKLQENFGQFRGQYLIVLNNLRKYWRIQLRRVSAS
ncbi:hypothetical protein GEMRC1_010663 [Eukaryota sp. GEM-RC1]